MEFTDFTVGVGNNTFAAKVSQLHLLTQVTLAAMETFLYIFFYIFLGLLGQRKM